MEKCDKSCQIGRVEYDYDMFDIRAVCFDVFTELFCYFAIAFKEVFTCHAGFTRGSA